MLDRLKYLAKLQQKTSLITLRSRWWDTIVIKTSPNCIFIKPSSKRWFKFAGWFGLGLFTVFSAFYDNNLQWYECIILTLFGLAMLYASTSSLVLINKIWWRPNGEKVAIFLGSPGTNKIITVSRDDIETHLYLSEKSWFETHFAQGSAVLSLRKKNSDDSELIIAVNKNQTALDGAFAMLSEFLGGICNDETIETVEMPDGKPMTVYKTGLTADITGQKRMDMSIPSDGQAIFKRRWDHNMFRYIMGFVFSPLLIAIAILVIASCPGMFSLAKKDPTMYLPIFILIGGGPGVFIYALCFFYPIWKTRYVIADRTTDRLSMNSKPQLNFKNKCLCKLSNIAAVQICSVYKVISQSKDWETRLTVFELNLVLKDPLGSRINLIVDTGEEHIRKIAADFAVFLKVPLLDHAGAVFQNTSTSR